MALGCYKTQLVATRFSVVAQDVAVMDLGWIHGALGTRLAVAGHGVFTPDLAGLSAPSVVDQDALLTAIDTFLAFVADNYNANTLTWDIIKLYEHGPGHPVPNEPIRTLDVSHNGSGLHSAAPQIATTCTLETASRRHWGRIYVPSLQREQIGDNGRLANGIVDGLPDAVETMFNTSFAHSWYPVVWQRSGEETTGAGRTVTAMRSDDLVDIQRRRRWEGRNRLKRVAIA